MRRLVTVLVVVGASFSLFPRESAATVEEQRARLPPPADCPDKVEGTWAALYYTKHHSWSEYTVVIRRSSPAAEQDQGGPIEVDMKAHIWDGPVNTHNPPACTEAQREVTVTMPGKGTVDASMRLAFGAKTYAVESVVCGSDTRYHPDNFTGQVDSASLATPPAFAPPKRNWSCSR